MSSPIDQNTIFSLAATLVNYSNRHVFLTGKAGTGKTTFLRHIRNTIHKNAVVAAPTGVAAINAGGTTLHSLLQLPFGIFVPEGNAPLANGRSEEIHDKQSLARRLKFSGNRKKTITALELLIIDEISMVRADVLDMVDTVLRLVRKNNDPFGGIQVLYIGDMFQLPPVIKEQDWEILKEYYKSAYFFDAKVIQEAPPVYIELNKVYRQSDPVFVQVLNEVRNNQLTDHGIAILASRYQPAFRPPKEKNYITLCTHNYKADQINAAALDELKQSVKKFEADVTDEFPDSAFPAEKILHLKIGAQVMFLKNDTESPRRFFNGKIGCVKSMDAESILIQCPEEEAVITVTRETWRNLRYHFDNKTKRIKEEELGTFSQFPLRLAWAITIHKSQGLTFENAIIDAGNAFAPGQVYVALSRCTSLEGMVLRSPLRKDLVFTEERVARFGRKERSVDALHDIVQAAKNQYFSQAVMHPFEWISVVQKATTIQQLFKEPNDLFTPEASNWIHQLLIHLTTLHQLAAHHLSQLSPLLQIAADVETDKTLQIWLSTHVSKLLPILSKNIGPLWEQQPTLKEGKNRKSAELILTEIQALSTLIDSRWQKLIRLEKGFDVHRFFQPKPAAAAASLSQKPSTCVVDEAGFSSNNWEMPALEEELYRQLRQLTNAIVDRENMPSYMVANAATLNEMATYLPLSPKDLLKIAGFAEKKVAMWGEEYIDIIQDYCEMYGIKSRMQQKPTGKPNKESHQGNQKPLKGETVNQTLAMWQEGKNPTEIAENRGLTLNTIEGHLATCIATGILSIDQVMDNEKKSFIATFLPADRTGISLTNIKEQIGNAATFGEIRMVMAWMQHQQLQSEN